MIRPLVMTLGFVGSTLALIWVLGGAPEEGGMTPDQVSRATPDVMGLQPALNPLPSPVVDFAEQANLLGVRPVARPDTLRSAADSAEAAQGRIQAMLRQAPVAAPVTGRPAPVAVPAQDRVDHAIEAMGYGILEELKKPVTSPRVAQPKPQQTASIAPQSTPEPALRTYTVQPGDSLPGIAFRLFGTTVAYLQILQENQDVLRSPGDLRAGMILTIPD